MSYRWSDGANERGLDDLMTKLAVQQLLISLRDLCKKLRKASPGTAGAALGELEWAMKNMHPTRLPKDIALAELEVVKATMQMLRERGPKIEIVSVTDYVEKTKEEKSKEKHPF